MTSLKNKEHYGWAQIHYPTNGFGAKGSGIKLCKLDPGTPAKNVWVMQARNAALNREPDVKDKDEDSQDYSNILIKLELNYMRFSCNAA